MLLVLLLKAKGDNSEPKQNCISGTDGARLRINSSLCKCFENGQTIKVKERDVSS